MFHGAAERLCAQTCVLLDMGRCQKQPSMVMRRNFIDIAAFELVRAQVRLHMLQEAADVAALTAEGCLGPHERQRRLRWPERLRITQSSLATQARIRHLVILSCVLT